uniref:Retrotransposon gag protein n=1 Tax=Musca domestica TaxID=7370 RepID=T1PLK3_MUSDO
MPAAAAHAPARTSLESVILSSHALASGLTSQQPNSARGYPLPYPERVNPPPVHDPRPLSLGPFNQPPPGFTSSGAPAQPPTSFSEPPPVTGVQAHPILPTERLPNMYSRGMRTEPHETHTSPHPSSMISEISGRFNLAKWGVSFDGTDRTMSVQEFIFRVGELKKDYNCPDEVLITKFHQLLEKPALDWYWNHRKLVQFRTWKELESALLAQYQRFENEFQLQMQILNRRQLPQENFEEFYNDVLRLRTQQKSPYREHEIVEIMRGNLKPSLAQMIFSAQISSLGDFYRQVKKAENLVWSQRQQRYNTPQKVHEIDWQMEEEPRGEIEVDAVTMTSKYKCWNCGVVGHSWMECREPRKIFCYRCGLEDVTVPDCPKCQGNRPRNPPQSGQVRSTPV